MRVKGTSVGLGVCSACRAPGAYFYADADTSLLSACTCPYMGTWGHMTLCPTVRLRGVWMCDSCTLPHLVSERVAGEIKRYRKDNWNVSPSAAI